MIKVLDLSGYMFSGKSAVSDLISEFDGFSVPYYRTEFDLIRIPHGLMDLKIALDNWSWIRSDSALREFMRLTTIMGRTPRGFFQKLFQTGFGYENHYPSFNKITQKFIKNITDDSWEIKWPYETASLCPWDIALLKVSSKLKRQHAWPEIHYRLCSGDEFKKYSREYISTLLSINCDKNSHTTVTHNMLEPYDPSSGFCFFDNIKSIVVDRDVRDIYITGSTHSDGFNDMVPLYSKIIGAFDIDIFIQRQNILRNKTNYNKNQNVLRIQFEDLILNYETTVNKVFDFLEISSKDHVNKMKSFIPEKSAENVGLWRNAPNYLKENVQKIEQYLPDLCYQ
jgi:hypothetical protein